MLRLRGNVRYLCRAARVPAWLPVVGIVRARPPRSSRLGSGAEGAARVLRRRWWWRTQPWFLVSRRPGEQRAYRALQSNPRIRGSQIKIILFLFS